MPADQLWAATLSQMLIHAETGCAHAAHHAALLLEQLSEADGVDDDTRCLCERAIDRLQANASKGCPA